MNQLGRIHSQDIGQVFLAEPRLAGGIRLDEKRQVLGQVPQHGGSRVIGIGEVAEIGDALASACPTISTSDGECDVS